MRVSREDSGSDRFRFGGYRVRASANRLRDPAMSSAFGVVIVRRSPPGERDDHRGPGAGDDAVVTTTLGLESPAAEVRERFDLRDVGSDNFVDAVGHRSHPHVDDPNFPFVDDHPGSEPG